MSKANVFDIRPAVLSDIDTMTDIYAYHVLHGTGSFEEIPPTHEEMLSRWQLREAGAYPTIVASINGCVAGFAYAGVYKPRSAYRFTVEDSIYVAADFRGQGVGQRLLEALIGICTEADYRQMIAVIGDSANRSSIQLHERCGFSMIGKAVGLGFKHGKWLDVVYMQRQLVQA